MRDVTRSGLSSTSYLDPLVTSSASAWLTVFSLPLFPVCIFFFIKLGELQRFSNCTTRADKSIIIVVGVT